MRLRLVPGLTAAVLVASPAISFPGPPSRAGMLDVVIGPRAASAQSPDLPVRRTVLDNGMRVLLLPRPGAPTMSFVMQLGVGGVHETPGVTGIAHLLEHMLFKGSETIGTTDVEAERALFVQMDAKHDDVLSALAEGDSARARSLRAEIDALEDEARAYVVPNEFDRILTRAGAQGLNATTTNEATTYYVEFPSNRAELFFAIEADRMANPVFREFYSERDVVMEERRMRVDTSPAGALFEAHMRAAFTTHPYGQPVVGTMDDLGTLRRSDVADYYRRFYGPGNAVLAVVGRFDPDEVEGWARAYFGSIPAGEEPAGVDVTEPRQAEERRVELPWDAQPALRIGWHVPSSMHPDAPALAMLSALLTGGRGSRLYRDLVTERSMAAQIFSTMGPGSLYPQLFQIDAAPIYPTTTDELERSVYGHIERVAREGVSAEEVERVRNQIAAGAVRRIQSNLGLAFQLADSESLFDDWRETFRASDRLRAVTAEDVQRVAGRYFAATNRTVAVLVAEDER